jgi:hypothetical protein
VASCYDAALAVFSQELDSIRRHLHGADVAMLVSDALRKEQAAQMRAFAYVWLSATLEEFVKSALQDLLRELASYSLRQCDLIPSLLSLVNFRSFDSLRDVGGLAMWQRRTEVLDQSLSQDSAAFSDGALPLDGRTIRPEHLRTIWQVFRFPVSALPGVRHALALNDLADSRNEIAHGRVPPIAFGRRKVTSDVLRIADYVEDFGTSLAVAIDEYLSHRQYLR